MTDTRAIPEPLLRINTNAAAIAPMLRRADDALARYRAQLHRGGVLPNSVEALRVELTYHSNAIEGCTLTLRETQLILEGQSPGVGKPIREIYEARNHDRALRVIEQWAETRSSTSEITEKDVLTINANVLADIDATSAGRLRTERVLIKGTRFVPPASHKFGVLLPALLDLANQAGVHPAAQAAELHYNVVAVHPFNDGNGRTARLLMNYCLLRHGYPLTVIEVERRAEYLAALEHANAGDPGPFVECVVSCIERSIERLVGPV